MEERQQPQPPLTPADNTLDDVLVNRTDHRPVVEHVFFQASQQTSHEQSQAIARLIIVGLVDLVLAANLTIVHAARIETHHLIFGLGYLLYSLFHYGWTRRHTQHFVMRRHLAIVGDLGWTSYTTYLFGLSGLGFYPLYLWIIIGNGLRFGPRYLRIATLVGIAGFIAATTADSLIFQHPGIVGGLMVGLVLMPKFFLVMIHRLADANQALRDQKEHAEYLARHDQLTGLANRIMLEDRINLALEKAARSATRPAVVFLDLDGFKAINDNFGHDYGDQLLQEIATCLQSRVRRGDTVARLGGDEFIILIEAANAVAEVAAVVDQIFTCAGRYYQLGEYRAYVTWSCGVAIFPADGEDSQTLIKNADIAMYRAKAAGTNLFRLYDPTMSEEVANQLQLRDRLRDALESKALHLLYEPIGRYPGAHIDAVQARLYWMRDPRHPAPLNDYVEILEPAGLFGTVADQTLSRAVADVARWRRAGLDLHRVQIEVGAQQLARSGFLPSLQQLLAEHELPANALAFAVSEALLIQDSQPVIAQLNALHDLGVLIVLSRFGSGYTALGFLTRHPIDRITMDPALVAHLPNDPSSCTLAEALLAIAERTRIEVVADGVETQAQVAWLAARGCHLMQGRRIQAPVPAADMEQLLHDGVLAPPAEAANLYAK